MSNNSNEQRSITNIKIVAGYAVAFIGMLLHLASDCASVDVFDNLIGSLGPEFMAGGIAYGIYVYFHSLEKRLLSLFIAAFVALGLIIISKTSLGELLHPNTCNIDLLWSLFADFLGMVMIFILLESRD